jgi:DUF971 family protein
MTSPDSECKSPVFQQENIVEAKKYLTTLIKELVIASEYKIKIPYELLDGSESGFFDGCFFLNDVIYFDYWKKK